MATHSVSQVTDPKTQEADFLKRFPDYAETQALDDLRKTDYARLDELGQVYLDYTGGNLYGISQLERHHDLLRKSVLGNPHSANPSSILSTQLVEDTRHHILEYFRATDDYYCVFTQNASGALKIIGECYPFKDDGFFLLTYDNHNSVNGIREYARSRGGQHSYVPLHFEDLRINTADLQRQLQAHSQHKNKLFAFPAQSNVSGVKHPQNWIAKAQELGWDVLLDAAAYVPSSRLDLSVVKPDFVSISFYKIFGYPTGLGCLLVRKDSFQKLQKPWFAGGTVTLASVMADNYFLDSEHARFEDGTINYLDIPALKIGIEHIEKVGIETINKRVMALTGWLLEELQALKHSNGQPVVQLFGPLDTQDRGGTLIMNFIHPEGEAYPFQDIERLANEHNISIRTGCFCNPGIDEINSHLELKTLARYFDSRENGDYQDMIHFLGKMRGAVRVSVGLATNFADVAAYLAFAREFVDR